MATMNDIAKAAGVSRGTVSNVLNGRGCVSYEKIRMVEDAAARLGYSLDKRASTLRKGVSGSIALIIPDISEKKSAISTWASWERPKDLTARSACTYPGTSRTGSGRSSLRP